MQIKNKTLIVELPAKDTEYISWLVKKGKQAEADDYESHHKQVIADLKTAFSKFWTYHEKMVFVPSDSLIAYMGIYPNYYVVMRYGYRLRLWTDPFVVNYLAPSGGQRYMSLCVPGEEKEVLFCLTPKKAALGEFIICMHQFRDAIKVFLAKPELYPTYVNAYTQLRGEKPRYETKNLMLLIKRSDLDMEKVKEEKIAKVYPYSYKIVDDQEWTDALVNQKTGVACYVLYGIYLSPQGYQSDTHVTNRFDNGADTKQTGGLNGKYVYVAADGHGEMVTVGKDLAEEMAAFKKQLDKLEKKANQAQKD